MEQGYLFFVLGLTALLIGALGLNHYLYRREELARERRRLFTELKQQAELALDALVALRQTPCSAEIPEFLNQHCVALIGHMKELSTEPDYLEQLSAQAAKTRELTGGQVSPDSDKGIRDAQQAIRQALRILKRMQQQKKLPAEAYSRYHEELAWLHTLVEVDAHTRQGQRLLKTGKRSVALTHLKHAKVKLTAQSIPRYAQEKKERLAQLQQLLREADPLAAHPFLSGAAKPGEAPSTAQASKAVG